MLTQKRGLSTVVTTLIIILLVLVAIGIIWIVIRGFIESGTNQADYAAKCLQVDVRASAVVCNTAAPLDTCNVTLNRKAGGEAIGGIKMVFKNSTLSSGVKEITGDIAPLTTNTSSISTGIVNSSRIEVTAFFVDGTGAQQICTITQPFEF